MGAIHPGFRGLSGAREMRKAAGLCKPPGVNGRAAGAFCSLPTASFQASSAPDGGLSTNLRGTATAGAVWNSRR